jgi:hypothetical protein
LKTDPLQTGAGVRELLNTGIGLTTTSTLNTAALVQPFAVRVYLYLTVIGSGVVLTRVSFGFPFPEPSVAGRIPVIAALVQAKPVDGTELSGS